MAKSSTSWKPGKSGNPKGRPPREHSLVNLLNSRLDRTVKGVKLKTRLIDALIDAGVKGNVFAIGRIFEIVQRSFEFSIKAELVDRLDAIEKRLEDMENEKQS